MIVDCRFAPRAEIETSVDAVPMAIDNLSNSLRVDSPDMLFSFVEPERRACARVNMGVVLGRTIRRVGS
jgi:hypothetical protein